MMQPVLDMPTAGKRGLLERMVFRGIVFNMSWEDPEMDRRAFQITPSDTVISISSAGCNPLNFLCQNPKKLISVDGNPAQNAILELKLAAIATLDYETFFDIFAARHPSVVTRHYQSRLRPLLSDKARQFWDKKLWIVARNLYDFGRMGLFCRLLRLVFSQVGLSRQQLDAFFEIQSLDEQTKWYHKHVARKLWGPVTRAFVNFKPFLYLAGVHPRQFNLVDGRHDIYDYIKERVDYALTRIPVYDNYFLTVAVTGKFRGKHVPPYLLEENFDTLRKNLDRVQVVNGWLGPFLDTQPAGSITKFNLLDIFDWMTDEQFEGTLRSALRTAAPGATMIYRSGSYQLDPPPAIREHLEHDAELSRELLAIDRSATYGSFYVFSVKSNGNGKAVAREQSPSGSEGHIAVSC
ncbi:MAG: BtaA family protein [Phycisphaerae bacterium]|nr:BtaA family protein [Phycisphaerae bacterium]